VPESFGATKFAKLTRKLFLSGVLIFPFSSSPVCFAFGELPFQRQQPPAAAAAAAPHQTG
jgi:hypothetical protein